MEKLIVRYPTAKDAIPAAGKTESLPKARAKRQVARPFNGKAEEDLSSKRQRKSDCTLSAGDSDSTNSISATNQESVSASAHSEPTQSDNDSCVPSSQPLRGKYQSYSVKEKLAICDYARRHGVRVAARDFELGKSTIGNWMKMDFEGQRTELGHLPRCGRPVTYSQEIEEKICQYVREKRDLQNAVSVEELCQFAKSQIEATNPDFKASRSWAEKFMKRHDLVLRTKASVAQRLSTNQDKKKAQLSDCR